MSEAHEKIDNFKSSFDNYGNAQHDARVKLATNAAVGLTIGALAGYFGAKDKTATQIGLAGAGLTVGVGASLALDSDSYDIVFGNKSGEKSIEDIHKEL